MKIIYLILLLSISGCTFSDQVETVRMQKSECVTVEQKRELARFILACAEAANPMSDEEGEDLVIQCERTGRNTICPTQMVCKTITRPKGFLTSYYSSDYSECK